MKLIRNVSIVVAALVIVLAGGAYATFSYMNPPPQLVNPNYYEFYQTQDTKPEGKVGIFISGLFQPTNFKAVDYKNMALKSTQYIPWPFRAGALEDRGIVLLDSEKYYEFEEFAPTNLVDAEGRNTDVDGVPYVDKYESGDVIWVPPNPARHLDHGYFLLTTRKAGMPTIANKLVTKARVYYYAKGKGFVRGKVPHSAGNRIIHTAAMDKLQEKYGPIAFRWVTAEDFDEARKQMHSLLDEGVDTVIFVPAGVIYSHHEVFNGSIKHGMHYVHEWEEENGKHIKTIIAPQLGDFDIMREAHKAMLRDRLDTLPAGSDVKVVVSMHGMAWDLVPHEAWIELAPPYRDKILEDIREIVDQYDFGRTEVVLSQDHFADPYNNPDGKYLSTNKGLWDAINDGYDYAIHVPAEFFSENTDTLFSHAMFNYEGFPDYEVYEPIDYPDWSTPYTREFTVENTKIHYNGVPAGDYNKPIIEAYVQSIDSILSQSMEPAGDVMGQAESSDGHSNFRRAAAERDGADAPSAVRIAASPTTKRSVSSWME